MHRIFNVLTLVFLVACSPKSLGTEKSKENPVAPTSTDRSSQTALERIFKNKKPIIGVVNLHALPGQKGFTSMKEAVAQALSEMAILEEEGVDGVIFENLQGDMVATPEMMAAMTVILNEAVKKATQIVVGVEVLWHDPKASLAIAKATGAKFIRTDFFVDEMNADGVIIKEDTKKLLEYRESIGAKDVVLLTDIQVKYAEMVDPNKTIAQSALEAFEAGSDGIVVTGRKSGMPPSIDRVQEAKEGSKGFSIVLGSGTSVDNIRDLFKVADAAIVGTSISTKTGGVLIRSKVREYMDVVREIRKEL